MEHGETEYLFMETRLEEEGHAEQDQITVFLDTLCEDLNLWRNL